MVKVNIKKLNENTTIPTRGSEYSAGMDLYACITDTVIVYPHSTTKIPSGFAIEIPKGYFGGIFARSGLSTREGIRPSTCTSIIDSDYRGEIIIPLHNDSDEIRRINPNDRIAQLVIIPCLSIEFNEVDDLNNTNRGTGGFGSTGI